MGHVGLTPQTATALGGYRAQGRTAERARAVLDEALALQEAGCFAIVFEAIPADVTDVIMGHMEIPVIGIGAGREHGRPGARPARPARDPRRLPARSSSSGTPTCAARCSAGCRRTPRTSARARFPGPEHTYGIAPEELHRLQEQMAAAAARVNKSFTSSQARSQLHSRRMVQLSKLFAPKEREFFDLFEEAGANIVRAAGLLERMLDEWPDHGELARDVVVCEQEGDRITHDIIQRLNQTFVTPIDREDIYALASGPRRHRRLDRGGRRLLRAVPDRGADGAGPAAGADPQPGLPAGRPRDPAAARTSSDIHHFTVEINRYENEGDRVVREALASLFEAGIDPMLVIRWKDIFERLEDAIDATEKRVEHPRGDHDQEHLGRRWTPPSCSGSWSGRRWRSTSPTASTTPRTRSPRRSRPARSRRGWRSRSPRS